MIDDNVNKQSWFLEILQALNERVTGNAFEAGFGLDYAEHLGHTYPKAADLSQNPAEIFKALHDEKGIYLVDLHLPVAASDSGLLETLFDASPSVDFQAAAREYRELASETGPLGTVAKEFSSAVLALLYCRRTRRPAMLVSTDTASWHVTAIDKAGLARVVAEGFPNQHRTVSTLSSQDLTAWANRILALIDPWIDLEERTSKWFCVNPQGHWDYETGGLPHDAGLFKDATREGHEAHIRKVLGWKWIPATWWADDECALAFHECLKTIVGNHCQWRTGGGDKPLSLAGAYFILLVALNQKAPDSIEPYLVSNWKCFFPSAHYKDDGCIPLIPSQSEMSAAMSMRCLYEFFLQIINIERTNEFGLGGFRAPKPGNPFFSIRLHWNMDNIVRFGREIRDVAATALNSAGGKLGLSAGQTVGALFRFLVASQASEHGFGAKGLLRLNANPSDDVEERGWLRIGQFSSFQ